MGGEKVVGGGGPRQRKGRASSGRRDRSEGGEGKRSSDELPRGNVGGGQWREDAVAGGSLSDELPRGNARGRGRVTKS